MLKGNSHEDDSIVIVSSGHRQHRESERDGLNMTVTVTDGASTSTPRGDTTQFGSQTARESTRLYNRDSTGINEDRGTFFWILSRNFV